MTIWDRPLRIFHWTLVLSVVGAVTSAWLGGGWMVWHGRLGMIVLGLVVFRLVWGVVGSETARFAQFVRGPAAIRAYLRGEWRSIGHNPLGALSVIAMLGVLGLQAASGHFASDDIAFAGPLARHVGNDWVERITGLHHLGADLLLGLIALHLLAIAFYVRVKGQDLVRPMLTGQGRVEGAHPPRPARVWALPLALGLAVLCAWAAQGGWLAAEPAPAANKPTADAPTPDAPAAKPVYDW